MIGRSDRSLEPGRIGRLVAINVRRVATDTQVTHDVNTLERARIPHAHGVVPCTASGSVCGRGDE